ncbi:hypothetical protein UPYG_G00236920, partial [Umbra pygmaea]
VARSDTSAENPQASYSACAEPSDLDLSDDNFSDKDYIPESDVDSSDTSSHSKMLSIKNDKMLPQPLKRFCKRKSSDASTSGGIAQK